MLTKKESNSEIDFRAKEITRDKEGFYTKGSVHREDAPHLKVYAPGSRHHRASVPTVHKHSDTL